MPPRIAPLNDAVGEAAVALAKTPMRNGQPLRIFATLARHSRLLERTNALGGVFSRFSQVPDRERELVILRTAWRSGSAYEFGQHALAAADVGMKSEEIAAVARPDLSSWPADDRALLSLTDELVSDCSVGAGTWSALSARWSDVQLLELLMMIGFYRMLAGLLNSIRVEAEEGVPGWPQ